MEKEIKDQNKVENANNIKNDKKKNVGNIVLNIISDILFVGVMIILVLFMTFGFGNLSSNKVPSFFGTSYVRIMSGSMEASGFYKGDVAMLKKTNVASIENGDIIAFYYCTLSQPEVQDREDVDPAFVNDFTSGQSSFASQIVFHKVYDSYVDDEGYIWFKTYGTSNVDSMGNYTYDAYLTRSDYVVGVYHDSILADLLTFISSSTGIIAVVVAPSCVVLFLLLLNIIQIYDQMVIEKKKRKEQEFANIMEMQDQKKDASGEVSAEDKEFDEKTATRKVEKVETNSKSDDNLEQDSKQIEEKVVVPKAPTRKAPATKKVAKTDEVKDSKVVESDSNKETKTTNAKNTTKTAKSVKPENTVKPTKTVKPENTEKIADKATSETAKVKVPPKMPVPPKPPVKKPPVKKVEPKNTDTK